MYIYVGKKRSRCGNCIPCTLQDCGKCTYCLDMKKFGGPGRKKRCCSSIKCSNQSGIVTASTGKIKGVVNHNNYNCCILIKLILDNKCTMITINPVATTNTKDEVKTNKLYTLNYNIML